MVHSLLVLSLWVSSIDLRLKQKPPALFVEFRPDTENEEENRIFIDETTKRVKKQTRTQDMSDTKIHTKKLILPQDGSSANANVGEQLRSVSPTNENLFIPRSSSINPGMRQRLQTFLPSSIELGDMVALDTNQIQYSSFNRRISEKVVWAWANHILHAFEQMQRRKELGSTRKTWVTIVEVVMDKDGVVLSVNPLQLAGDSDMDYAPILAFQSAKNFPNPPDDLVGEDGYIRLKYSFLVNYNPSSR
jgi:hypothetical protein